MIEKLRHWWSWDPEYEKSTADNPLTPLTDWAAACLSGLT
jgi:hypothetical protein